MSERCKYCGRFLAIVDYGAEFGYELVCSQQAAHIVADPAHWTIGTLDTAVQVAKLRAGLSPYDLHPPEFWVDHLDEEWRQPFWARQVHRATRIADALDDAAQEAPETLGGAEQWAWLRERADQIRRCV